MGRNKGIKKQKKIDCMIAHEECLDLQKLYDSFTVDLCNLKSTLLLQCWRRCAFYMLWFTSVPKQSYGSNQDHYLSSDFGNSNKLSRGAQNPTPEIQKVCQKLNLLILSDEIRLRSFIRKLI
ncbi:unnamed protein product [Blepharisma stoltei]|uniref:Uncharacterized protein n=1 Tax=Blepharisma stoltei TaxID=1481888 RepID=A0AAU9JR63_9CILI|nr:unnamed protein product [Blepharisma stoltei]